MSQADLTQSESSATTRAQRPTGPHAILQAHVAFNDELVKVLNAIIDTCGSNKKLTATRTPAEEWVETVTSETKKIKLVLEQRLRSTSPTNENDAGFEASAVKLTALADYNEKLVFLAAAESSKLKKHGKDLANLLVLRSLGVLHREVHGAVLGSGAEDASPESSNPPSPVMEVPPPPSAQQSFASPLLPLMRKSSRMGTPQGASLKPSRETTEGGLDDDKIPDSELQPAPFTTSSEVQETIDEAKSSLVDEETATSPKDDDKKNKTDEVSDSRDAAVADAVRAVAMTFQSLAEYLPASQCDDATVRHIIKLCTDTIKSVDRTLFLLQSSLLNVVATAIRLEIMEKAVARPRRRRSASDTDSDEEPAPLERKPSVYDVQLPTAIAQPSQEESSLREPPEDTVDTISPPMLSATNSFRPPTTEPEVEALAAGKAAELTEAIGVVKVAELRTLHELCHSPIEYLLSVVAVSNAGTSTSSVTAKTQATVKSLLFQLLSLLARQTLHQSQASAPLTESWLRNASISAVYRVCDPVVFAVLRSLSRHCGDQSGGDLLAVRLLTDTIGTLGADDPGSLRALMGAPRYNKEIMGAILACCVSVHPSVLGAGLAALQTLVGLATVEVAQEAGFVYCNCLMRLLDSENTSHENKIAIVKHFNQLAVHSGGTSVGWTDDKTARPPLLFQLFWLFDLSPRLHHANFVQHLVATLSRIVRCAPASDLAVPHEKEGQAAAQQAGTPLSSTSEDDSPATLAATALQTLVTVMDTCVAAVSSGRFEFDFASDDQLAACAARKALKLELQQIVDIVNTAPLKGVAKLLKTDHKALQKRGVPPLPTPTEGEEGAEPVEDDPKRYLFNEWVDVPPPLPEDVDDLEKVADFLLHTPSLNPAAVGEFLSEPRAFPMQCSGVFMAKLQLRGKSLAAALSELLSALQLPKEGQRIERILEFFAHAYFDANAPVPGIGGTFLFPFKTVDATFVVIVATVMLNTDLHNPKVSTKMNITSFSAQLRGCNDNENFPAGFAESIFDNIARKPLSNVKGIGAASPDAAQHVSTTIAPEGKMDFFFFSKDERKELMFGIERQRIVAETRELLARRAKFEPLEVIPGTFAVARELFSSTWPTVHVVMSVAAQSSPEVAGGVLLRSLRGLQSCLGAAAAFALNMEGEVTLNSLVRLSQSNRMQVASLRAILSVASMGFGRRLNVNCWTSICQVLASVARGGYGGQLAADAENVFASLNQCRGQRIDSPTGAHPMEGIVDAAMTACFTVPVMDGALLAGHLNVLRRVLLPPPPALQRTLSNSGMGQNTTSSSSFRGDQAPPPPPVVTPDKVASANASRIVLTCFDMTVSKAITKLCGIHQGSGECLTIIADCLVAILRFLSSEARLLMPSSIGRGGSHANPTNLNASVCAYRSIFSPLIEMFFITDVPTVQLKAVAAAQAGLQSLLDLVRRQGLTPSLGSSVNPPDQLLATMALSASGPGSPALANAGDEDFVDDETPASLQVNIPVTPVTTEIDDHLVNYASPLGPSAPLPVPMTRDAQVALRDLFKLVAVSLATQHRPELGQLGAEALKAAVNDQSAWWSTALSDEAAVMACHISFVGATTSESISRECVPLLARIIETALSRKDSEEEQSQHLVSLALERLCLIAVSDREGTREAAFAALRMVKNDLSASHVEQLSIFLADAVADVLRGNQPQQKSGEAEASTEDAAYDIAASTSFEILGLTQLHLGAYNRASKASLIQGTLPTVIRFFTSDILRLRMPDAKGFPAALVEPLLTRLIVPLATAQLDSGAPLRVFGSRAMAEVIEVWPTIVGDTNRSSDVDETTRLMVRAAAYVIGKAVFDEQLILNHESNRGPPSLSGSPSRDLNSSTASAGGDGPVARAFPALPAASEYLHRLESDNAAGESQEQHRDPAAAGNGSFSTTPQMSSQSRSMCFASDQDLATLVTIFCRSVEPLAAAIARPAPANTDVPSFTTLMAAACQNTAGNDADDEVDDDSGRLILPAANDSTLAGLLLTATNLAFVLDACPAVTSSEAFTQMLSKPGAVPHEKVINGALSGAFAVFFAGLTLRGDKDSDLAQQLLRGSAALFTALGNQHQRVQRLQERKHEESSSQRAARKSAEATYEQLANSAANWTQSLRSAASAKTEGSRVVWSVARDPILFSSIVGTLHAAASPSVILAARQYLEVYAEREM